MHPELWVMPGTGWSLKSYGFMMTVGFLSAVYFAMRRAVKVKCDPDVVLNCAMISLVVGIVGARIFFVVHYWNDSFAHLPNPIMAALNITSGGLEFLGGLVPAMIAVPLYLWYSKKSIRVYTDILAISTMWALGIARMGCFLNGCCFGGVCADENGRARHAVAVEFPFGSGAHTKQWEDREVFIPAELISDAFPATNSGPLWANMPLSREQLYMPIEQRQKPLMKLQQLKDAYDEALTIDPKGDRAIALKEKLDAQRELTKVHIVGIASLLQAEQFPSRADPSRRTTVTELQALAADYPALWVHPTQLYSTAGAVILSVFMGRVFYRRKRHGMVFGMMMIAYPLMRIPMESIRADNPLDSLGFTVSQFVSMAMIVLGCVYLLVLYKFLPERSPYAIPFVPEEEVDDG